MLNVLGAAMLSTALLVTAGCDKKGLALGAQDVPSVHSTPVKLVPYLYDITYTRYSPGRMLEMCQSLGKQAQGASCSVVRNGRYVGRNLDFYYDEMAEFVVHVPAAPGRYESLGVSSCNINLTARTVDSGKDTPYYDMVPYFTTDGINEKGVYASLNMAPTGDLGITTGTNPGAETLCASMVVRHVLDNCASAGEACAMLDKMNITTLNVMGEFHYLIADSEDTYIVELIDNKLVYSRDAGNIMTNFYNLHGTYTPRACGVERYEFLKEHYAESGTLDGMDALMQKVRYSLSYDLSLDPIWYSEYYGYKWKGREITIDTPHDFYLDYIKSESKRYGKRKRNYLDDIWITVHQSVYDLEEKTLRVYVQEDYSRPLTFKLEEGQ